MLLLIVTFICLLMLKVPVAFTLLISSVVYMLANNLPLELVAQRMLAGPDSFPLMAVPFFILAGNIMNYAGVTHKIFFFANKLVGHLTGGLGHATVLACMIVAGMSGTAIAEAGGLGVIVLKAMKDAGYEEDFSVGVMASASLIGPIIPPSVPMVIFGAIAGVSIGKLFIAGVVPGILMGGAISIMIYFKCRGNKKLLKSRTTLPEFWKAFKDAFLSLFTVVIILGGMIGGIFTPTEAAVVATVYGLILGLWYKAFTIRDVPKMLTETSHVMVSVLFIVASASLFGWVLTVSQVGALVTDFFTSYFTNKYMVLIAINMLLLVVGCFMETIAAISIFTPILMPVVMAFGIDPVHFGLLMVLNLMIGLLTPPVGMVLYVLSSVTKIPFERIARVCTPYIIVLITLLYVITFVPALATWLPNLAFADK